MRYLLQSTYQNPALLAGVILISLIILVSFLGPLWFDAAPIKSENILADRYQAPDIEHPFGTDKFGRDVFGRVLSGGRISLFLALSVVVLSSTTGIAYGAISGYLGGRTDRIMMRILDFLLAFPVIFLLVMLIAVFELRHWYLIPILGLTGWMDTARLIRAEVLSLKERDFVLAAQGLGLSRFRILTGHILPNCMHVLFVSVPLKVGEVVLLESALSFLGIGIQPPVPSWGNMINDGRSVIISAWWISTFPGIFITSTVMGFYLISEGIKKRMMH